MLELTMKNKWQIRVVTMCLFALGFVAGALALNAFNLWFGTAKQPTKQERYQEAFNQLNLNETQDAEVQKIVAETRENIQNLRQESEPRMAEIRARNDVKLQSVLTAEQWAKFQKLRESIRQMEK